MPPPPFTDAALVRADQSIADEWQFCPPGTMAVDACQHAFARHIQRVSDAIKEATAQEAMPASRTYLLSVLEPFVLPPPIDHLQEALRDCDPEDPIYADALRKALAKRGLRVVAA